MVSHTYNFVIPPVSRLRQGDWEPEASLRYIVKHFLNGGGEEEEEEEEKRWSSYFMLPSIAGMTGMPYHTQLSSTDMGSHCPETTILFLASRVT
jgi:hypothetical protein